jgi:hypothetical protein
MLLEYIVILCTCCIKCKNAWQINDNLLQRCLMFQAYLCLVGVTYIPFPFISLKTFFLEGQSLKSAGDPMSEASKISLRLVKIPKPEVCLACVFFVSEVVNILFQSLNVMQSCCFSYFFSRKEMKL